ncbi:MAG: hypothetical protein N3E38_00325 [Candidatus Aenigmarchaeota archaeon]|nr:hypothetical protein [Candidatus Aenigmarchaeota archaeon]MCX8179172.1 hypothetical protein [Candidatus Aenigmarchaeota archaeon]
MTFLLIYDIPRNKNALLVRVWRKLKKMDAKKITNSVWSVEDDEKITAFHEIKEAINKAGGEAKIMKVVFIE